MLWERSLAMELYILAASVVSGMLYSWLGLGYANVFLIILFITGTSTSEYISVIALSQVLASLLGAYLRRKLIVNINSSMLGSIIIGISALASFLAALLVGVGLSDNARLITLTLVLILTSILLRAKSIMKTNSRIPDVLAGIVGGAVKGVLGGGITPVIMVFQRMIGVSMDETLFKTFIALSIISLSTSIPYILFYGIGVEELLLAITGAVIGVSIGSTIARRQYSSMRINYSSTAYGLLAALGLLKIITSLLQ